ncbi:hypothetical protein [Microseira sp. BLCC-F43]|jgi:hypothetical protein|uniref:hypothetical protein n=1 Tax=Microseira sp. BLCC-F43 TaxID=3153602 RepID=UPI0035B9DE68
MNNKSYSLREAINVLKQHQARLESQIGKNQIERLIFNLEEISLDLENISSQLINVATGEKRAEELPDIFDFFQYGAIPHIVGHLEAIEELLEKIPEESKTCRI